MYTALVHNRAGKGSGCPYCAGKKAIPGENDLATLHPELILEWSDNNTLNPFELLPKSNKVALWVCPAGHEYSCLIFNRTNGIGCARCWTPGLPKVVVAIGEALDSPCNVRLPDLKWPRGATFEVDILVGASLVVEYDGYLWHRTKETTDMAKTEELLNHGYSVIRIREHPLSSLPLKHSKLIQRFDKWTDNPLEWSKRLLPSVTKLKEMEL